MKIIPKNFKNYAKYILVILSVLFVVIIIVNKINEGFRILKYDYKPLYLTDLAPNCDISNNINSNCDCRDYLEQSIYLNNEENTIVKCQNTIHFNGNVDCQDNGNNCSTGYVYDYYWTSIADTIIPSKKNTNNKYRCNDPPYDVNNKFACLQRSFRKDIFSVWTNDDNNVDESINKKWKWAK